MAYNSKAFGIMLCLLSASCYGPGIIEQYTLTEGYYKSSDSKHVAILELKTKMLILFEDSLGTMRDTIGLGESFVVKGCPTNHSFTCEIYCYKLFAETLKVWQREIFNPVIGPAGNNLILCNEPDDKSSGGAGLLPSNNTKEYFELLRW